MRLGHIEIFHAILRAGTLTGAADLINISQPAATKRLQHAERQLGIPLFVRVRGGLQLTAEGEVLRERVERIYEELYDLQRLAANLGLAKSRILQVVSTPTLANALVPRAVTRLRAVMRDAKVELCTQHSREMLSSIMLRESDIGLTLQYSHCPGVKSEALFCGSMMVIAPAGYWRDSELNKPVPIDELSGERIVGIATRDSLGRELHRHFENLSPPPEIAIGVQTYQLARTLVSTGHGLALADPFTAISNGHDSLQIRPLAPELPVTLHAVYRADAELHPVQTRFLDCVRRVLTEMFDVPSGCIGGAAKPAAVRTSAGSA